MRRDFFTSMTRVALVAFAYSISLVATTTTPSDQLSPVELQLFVAAASGDIEQLNKAIEAGGDVDELSHNKRSLAANGAAALHVASMKCNKEVVEALLKAGAKVNLKSENEKNGGQTPLHYAVLFCNAGNEEVVQLLLDAGADPTLTNDDGHTPEQTMKIHTHQQIIENYRKYAATLKAISNIVKMLKPYYGNNKTAAFDSPQTATTTNPSDELYSTVFVAAASGDIEQLNKAIEAGGDVDQFAHGGVNALHMASMRCNKEVVDALLKAGAKVNLKTENEKLGGKTPLHYAVLFCNAGNEEVVQLLLGAGADPTLTNDDGHTPEGALRLYIEEEQLTEKYNKYATTLKARQDIMKMLEASNKKTEL